MAVLATDYTDATTPTGATTELPATTSRGLNAINAQINTNTTDLASAVTSGMLLPVRVYVTGAETFTIAAGTVTQIAGTTIQGVSPAVGDRILITSAPAATGVGGNFGHTNQPGNGIYTVTNNTTNLTVARAVDMSGTTSPIGRKVFSLNGSSWLGASEFTVAVPTSGAFTYGTTAMTWAPTGGAAPTFNGLITAGGGIAANDTIRSLSTNTVDLGTSTVLWRHIYTTDIELGAASDTTLSRSSAGVLAVEGVAVDTISATNTLTNKRITPRVVSPAVAGTYTVDWTNCDQYVIGTQNAAITNLTATGTALDGQKLMLRIKGDATPRTIAWDSAKYVSSGIATLLATTAASKTHFVGLVYDGVLGKMVCIAVDATGY